MRKVILLIVSVGVVLIAIAAYFILNSPARELTKEEKERALTQIVGRKLNLTGKNVPTGDTEHKGKYSSFLYPAAAKIYHQMVNGKEVTDRGALEYFAFDLQAPKVNVVTEVILASSSISNLSDYPSVRLRQTQSGDYTQTEVQAADGTSGLAFAKLGDSGFEKTAFFLTKGKIYSFSIICVDNKTEDKIFNRMITTLRLY